MESTYSHKDEGEMGTKKKVQNLKLINILISESLKVNWIES